MSDTRQTIDREVPAVLIGRQEFGVDVVAVREIRGPATATRFSPEAIRLATPFEALADRSS